MKRAAPPSLDISSSDDSMRSDSDEEGAKGRSGDAFVLPKSPNPAGASEGALLRKATMYQEYMKQIPVPLPAHRCSVIPCTSWLSLGRSVKQLYEQPLHYLTNIMLKEWDQKRVGSDDGHRPLDVIIHPMKAEALIWVTEEVHRLTTSCHRLAKLWASDPMYHAYIDPVSPSMKLD